MCDIHMSAHVWDLNCSKGQNLVRMGAFVIENFTQFIYKSRIIVFVIFFPRIWFCCSCGGPHFLHRVLSFGRMRAKYDGAEE